MYKRQVAYLLPLLLVLQSPWQLAQASSVDCAESPLTRLEASICNDPALRALDGELSATLKRSQDQNRLTLAQVKRVRNSIARQCRRETATKLQNCLLSAELDAFEQFAVPAARPITGRQSVKGKQLQRAALLARQLDVAQSSLRSSGNANLTVTTIVELLKIADKRRGSVNPSSSAEVKSLSLRLVQGCHHQRYAASWQAAVQANGLQCATLNRDTPVYSFSDFD